MPHPAHVAGELLGALLGQPTATATERVADDTLTTARTHGDDEETDRWLVVRGLVRVRRGHLDDGLADLQLALLRRSMAGARAPSLLHAGLVDCHLARGDLWRAHRSAGPLTRLLAVPDEEQPAAASVRLGRAATHHALGDLARAERDHASAWRHFRASGEALGPLADHPCLVPWRLEAAVSAVQLGLRVEARELVDAHLGTALVDERPGVVARALRVHAAVADHGQRLDLLEEAVRLADPEDVPRLAALVAVDLAAHLLLSGGDGARVSSLLAEAGELGRRFRITTTVARVDRMQAVLGRTVVVPPSVRGDQLGGLHLRLATMASAGQDDAAIAEELGLPPEVVHREVADVCHALGIRSRRRIRDAMAMPPAVTTTPGRRVVAPEA